MSGINGFPDDDNLWLVKWIDQIRLPHLSTTSASISVLIQKLSFTDPKLIHRLRGRQLEEVLSPKVDPTYETVRLLVALLPEVEIGDVFLSKNRVAQLPTVSTDITLPLAESSCDSQELFERLHPPHAHWPEKLPYRLLNRFEYCLDRSVSQGSNCLVFKTEDVDYIIPRSVIFKTFYAQNDKFAKAFTNGNWPTQCKTLVCMNEMDSGLKTGVDKKTGEWSIVLQLRVPWELTPLLGIYIFDAYGHKCASSIYASMLKAKQNKPDGSWFIDAKIPFSTTPETPVTLSIQGLELKTYARAEKGSPSKFLVTKITRSSLPSLPPLNYAYVINGQKGKEQSEVDEPAPFSNTANAKPANALTIIDSSTDSNPTMGAVEILSSSFSWIDPPQVGRLQKASSKSYNKPVKSFNPDNQNTGQVSPGNNTYSAFARPEAQIQTLIRQSDKRFKNLLAALSSLKTEKKIFDYNVLAPLQKIQAIQIGEHSCWNFLDEDSRVTGKWPKNGWRMKVPAEKLAGGRIKPGQPRAALVVRIDYTEDKFGYWIEIQQKSTPYRSPYILNSSIDGYDLVQHFLEIIARTAAKNLVDDLIVGAKEFEGDNAFSIKAYKHGYIKDTARELSPTSVVAFLKKCHEGQLSQTI